MSPEQRKQHGSYSRLGTLIFVVIMAFPFLALGWKLAEGSLITFGIYAALVVILALATMVAVYFAPTLKEPEPTQPVDLHAFDSEKHGVPW